MQPIRPGYLAAKPVKCLPWLWDITIQDAPTGHRPQPKVGAPSAYLGSPWNNYSNRKAVAEDGA